MLISADYEGRKLRLVDPKKANHKRNVFTLIVGKNGTGKSRLLNAIVTQLAVESMPHVRFNVNDIQRNKIKVKTKFPPSKIITVSISPFDKFPVLRSRTSVENYTYLGLRDLYSRNVGIGYLSKIIGSLIDVILNRPQQLNDILDVLQYLGYSDQIGIQIEISLTHLIGEKLFSQKQIFDDLARFERLARANISSINTRLFYNEDGSISKRKIEVLEKVVAVNYDLLKSLRSTHTLTINRNGIDMSGNSFTVSPDLPFLIQTGIIRLRRAILSKQDSNELFSISNASSGEQSVLMSILGIASQISDGSLICIDEPEVCLHPEWQERYIKLLTTTFQKYSSCHFLVATHSPQIVSNLEPKNSFVLSMETGKLVNAQYLAGHSSDYQLASIFDSPGYKNEYLSRIAISVFTKVSKNRAFDIQDRENFKILSKNSRFLDENDPVLDLYSAIKDMHKLYA